MNAGRSAALSVNSYLTLRNQTFLYRVYIDSVTQWTWQDCIGEASFNCVMDRVPCIKKKVIVKKGKMFKIKT